MAKSVLDTRYLVLKPKAAPTRAYWQPDDGLRAAGWAPRRLAPGLAGDALRHQAAIAADRINQDVDAWRAGTGAVNGGAAAATDPAAIKQPGTLAWLAALYEASDECRENAPKTRREYAKALRVLETWAGDLPLAALTKPRWRKFYKQLHAATPAQANALMRVGRLVWNWGLGEGHAPPPNPLAELGLKGAAPAGAIWPRAAVEAFVEVADKLGWRSIGTAVVIDEVIGQREADVLKLPRNILRPSGLVVRQNKTGAGVVLPIAMVPWVKARIEGELALTAGLDPLPTRLLICETTGRPWKADHFRHVFAEIRRVVAQGDEERGIAARPRFVVDYAPAGAEPDDEGNYAIATTALQFKHLRHTAITRLADVECETSLIAAVSGHSRASVEKILEVYLIRTRRQAVAAFTRLVGDTAAPAKTGGER